MPRSNALYVGIDLGTSGCRAIAINYSTEIVAQAAASLPAPVHKHPQVEQNPALWWQAVCTVLSELLKKIDARRIKAISVDGTSGTVLLANENGQPVSPALMYNDSRAINELERINQIAPDKSVVHSVTAGLPKLLWLQKQHYPHAHYFLHQADWISGKFSGQFGVSDLNNSLKTGFDPVLQCWPDWFDQLDINRNILPVVIQPGTAYAMVSKTISRQFGLDTSCQIIAGTTDSTAAFLATGAHKPGKAVTVLGSTLVLKIISQQPVFNADYGIYSQPLPNITGNDDDELWLCGGASNSGGAVLRQYFTDAQMAAMQAQLKPEIKTGLKYYPLPAKGERFPVNDPELEPQLSPRPDNDVVFFQGLLEGLSRIEKEGYDKLHAIGTLYPTSVRTTGGGAQNLAWTRIRERILNVPVIPAHHTEAAYGSALLARFGSK